MGTQPLPLSIIADVTVVTASPQVASPTFNSGLVIGPSTAIPSYGVNPRIRKYLQGNWSSAMLADGFSNDDSEYICMQMYFSQSPPPQQGYVGRQDLTALQTITINVPGTLWAVGDKFSVDQGSGAEFGFGVVTAEAAGIPSVIVVASGMQGTSYSVATGIATTAVSPSNGIGLTVNITAIGETYLQAAQACRIANPQWYPFMCTGAVNADHIALSAWALGQVGTVYFGTTADTPALNGTPGNVLSTIYGASSKRTWMQWSSTQGGGFPNQIYFTAAVMGQAMASNTQLQNSAFTEKFSGGVPLIGVFVEPLSTTQIANIEGSTPAQGPNGNLFLNYANSFSILEQGTMMAEDVFFDQILNLDILASDIQYNVLNVLTSVPKVPQTDAGQQMLVQAVERACDQAGLTGFIAGGIWEGQNILGLKPGTSLPTGYVVLTPSYSTWGPANPALIAARQAPPIYVAIIEAGAVHFVTIEVLVQV